MLFSSLLAISQAVYNLPHEGCNYRNSVNGPVRLEMQTQQWRSKWINTWNFLHLHKNRYLLTFPGDWRQPPGRLDAPTYWGWGTWAGLFFCTHLGGTWRSRLWLFASPRRSGWGSCRFVWSGSSRGGPAPWPRLWRYKFNTHHRLVNLSERSGSSQISRHCAHSVICVAGECETLRPSYCRCLQFI